MSNNLMEPTLKDSAAHEERSTVAIRQMSRFWFSFILGFTLVAVCDVRATSVEPAGDFLAVTSLAEVPTEVRAEIERRFSEPLSDVGGPFNATDVDDGRASRRFVVAGHAVGPADYWVVCYEHGGIGYHYHVALFERVADKVHIIKAGQWLPSPEKIGKAVSIESVVTALRNGEVEDGSYW